MSELLAGLSAGWSLLATPSGIAALVLGVVLGFVVGVIPGFGGANAVAVLLPFSIMLGPANSTILMIAIYCGTAFGGSIPAILLNIPGESGSAVVALDGYPMAHAGRRPHLAIGISRMASVVGGIIGVSITIVLIQPLSNVAVKIGPAEMFVVALMAIVTCGSLVGNSVPKGILAGLLGVLISLTGAGPVTVQSRMDFGIPELYSGIPLIPAIIGMFAFCELVFVSRELTDPTKLELPVVSPVSRGDGLAMRARRALGLDNFGELLEGMRVTLRQKAVLLQSSILGVFVGCIPGLGSSVAGFLAYSQAKDRAKDPETFGTGNPVGIIAPEACDNATSGGILVPTLTLGVPGNGTSAVLLAALYLNGVQIGPLLLSQNPGIAYSSLLAALIASILILPLGILLAGPMIQLTRLRLELLIPSVLVVSVLGAYSAENSMVDVGIAVIFGLIALLLRLCGYPVIPLFLGFVLGPLAEASFVRALTLGRGDVSIFWLTIESKVLLVCLGLIVLSSVVRMRRQRRRRRTVPVA